MRTEDGYLISKCLAGETETFGLLVDKYKSSIYAFAYAKLRDFQDAEDVTQEVFITAYQKLHRLRRWDSFLAWLYAIASNRCKKELNARARGPDSQYLEDEGDFALNRPSMDAYHRERGYEPLYEALESLSETYRQVLALHYLGGLKSREIAQFLGTSKNTIDQRLFRAKAKLKAALSPDLIGEEMITMMTTTFDDMKLQPSFTFRVVEAIKETKIQTAPHKSSLPFGVSAAVGLIALWLSMTIPHSPLYPIGEWIGSALPSQTQVAEDGVIPVDTVEVTKITLLTSESGEGNFGQKPRPDPIRVFGGGTWEKKGNMQNHRAAVPTIAIDGKIYAFGGWKWGVGIVPTVDAYDPARGTWEKKKDMPTTRSAAAAAMVNGKVYVIGGQVNDGKGEIRTVEEYDLKADTWVNKADMPTRRSGLSALAVDGKIYAIGGFQVPDVFLATVEMYDPPTDTWAERRNMPTPRVAVGAVVNGKIYVIGGALEIIAGEPKLVQVLGITSIVEVYDPLTDTWSRAADMPTARWSHGVSVLKGKIFVFGGRDDRNRPVSQVEMYDPATDTWTILEAMPEARGNLSATTVDGEIYIIGGEHANRPAVEILAFDPEGVPEEPQSINPNGKLATTWAELKAAQ